MPKINLFAFWLLFAQAAMALDDGANNLTTTGTVGASKINISVRVEDLQGVTLSAVPLNRMMRLSVDVKQLDPKLGKALELINFTAVMPSHRHGMITKAQISKAADGRYRIDGVKLHMPGTWEFLFHLKVGSEVAQVAIPLKL